MPWRCLPHSEACESLVNALAQVAMGATSRRKALDVKMDAAKENSPGNALSMPLMLARQTEQQACQLARDVRRWFTGWRMLFWRWPVRVWWTAKGYSISSLPNSGIESTWTRRAFVRCVQHWRNSATICWHLPGCSTTSWRASHGTAMCHGIWRYLVRDLCLLQRKSPSSTAYWQRWNLLHKKLAGKSQRVADAVVDAMKHIPRASSLVENLNSRLRNYFFLRRQLGAPYLNLLQFFLNHRTFLRGHRPERVGKRPKELMTGQSHPRWLELLNFIRFQLP
jgi:hypothetical protein